MRRSSIKKNVRPIPSSLGFANNHQKMEVESIIFDSKVRQISAFGKLEDCSIKGFADELVQDRAISGFQEKVDKVN